MVADPSNEVLTVHCLHLLHILPVTMHLSPKLTATLSQLSIIL